MLKKFIKFTTTRNIHFKGVFSFNRKAYSIEKNYYSILQVPQNASNTDIKHSFHNLAKKFHPDLGSASEEKFKEVLEAYKVLSDENTRKEYDSDRERGKNSGRGSDSNFSSRGARSAGFQNQYSQGFNKANSRFTYEDHSEEAYKESGKYRQKTGYDGGNMVQEGLWNNMKEAPELFFITAVMILLLIRWFMLFAEADKQSKKYAEEDIDENRYFSGGKKIVLTEEDCEKLTIEELLDRFKSGKYLLPLSYESYVEEYKSLTKVLGHPPNEGMIPQQFMTIVSENDPGYPGKRPPAIRQAPNHLEVVDEALDIEEERRLRMENRRLLRLRKLHPEEPRGD